MKKRGRLPHKQLFVPVIITGLLLCSLVLLANMAAAGNSQLGGEFIVTSLQRVSVNNDGEEGNGRSDLPAVSADGHFVAFNSWSSNLVPGDTTGLVDWDVFVYDMQRNSIEIVSINSDGEIGNWHSTRPDISADGRYVSFRSAATNLVLNDTNNAKDIFVHDRQTGITSRVSVDSAGGQGNSDSVFHSISADGRFVTFSSSADNLVRNDTNNSEDVFVHDLQTGITERVSINSQGEEGNFHSAETIISGDGRFVVFVSQASNLVPGDTNGKYDVFMHDRQTGQTTRISVSSTGQGGDENSWIPDVSADGRYVAFLSYATNLAPGSFPKPQVYLHDSQTGMTKLVSASMYGEIGGNDSSGKLAVSADGRYIAYGSRATDLVPGDTNEVADVFVYDQIIDTTWRVSTTPDGTQGNEFSWGPAIVDDGQIVAYWSAANNLVVGDNNQELDIFVSRWRLFQFYLPVVVR